MSFFRKKIIPKPYDKENKKPMIKASICNGSRLPVLRIFVRESGKKLC